MAARADSWRSGRVTFVVTWQVEVNGHPATASELAYPATVNYGHFTTMQVRDGAVRGLALHLKRLDQGTRELFGTGLDGDLVRAHIRHALPPGAPWARVRVSVFQPDGDERPSVLVVIRPSAEHSDRPRRLSAVRYQRPLAHVKHAGTFGQIWFGRTAERAGFDDALLVGPDDVIAEGAVSNIGFFDGAAVIWPDAPALGGVTMELLAGALSGLGIPSRQDTVRVADLSSFRAVFLTNALGVAAVSHVDDQALPADPDFIASLTRAYESLPWDRI